MRDNHLEVEWPTILAPRARRVGYRFAISTALVIASISAAVVVWQNQRLTVLWDVSYILENATRMVAGDIPYRDFPFPYAPLTFIVQAISIRLFGPVYWHAVLYAAIACAAATLLTYAIASRLVSRGVALALTAPLALLGIYCVLPHPFYDPDCCLIVLALIAALMTGKRPLLIGALCVIPIFVKQNIGLAFVAALFVLLLIERRWRVVAGMMIGAAVAFVAVAAVFGVGNYARWTIAFAAARRLPPLALMLSVYADPWIWWMAATLIAGGVLLLWPRTRIAGAIVVALPWLWMAWRFFVTDDPNEREINLLRVWPVMLIVAFIAAIVSCMREKSVPLIPLLVIATIHGAFLSQVTWGSTYGIWPLLMLLFAFAFHVARAPAWVAIVIAVVMLGSATQYLRAEGRLTYAKWEEGEARVSSLPALRGMHMRGDWLPDFEELVAWTGAHIPREDGILSLPGEDLFYYATGRRPRFPVLMFDHTVNPYTPREIAAIAESRDIRWVIVKRRLQLNGTPFPELGDTIHLLRAQFAPVAFLRNYVVLRRNVGRTSVRPGGLQPGGPRTPMTHKITPQNVGPDFSPPGRDESRPTSG